MLIGGTSGSKNPAGSEVHWRGHRLFGQVCTPVTDRTGQRDRISRAFCAVDAPQYGVGYLPPEAGPTVVRESGPCSISVSTVARRIWFVYPSHRLVARA